MTIRADSRYADSGTVVMDTEDRGPIVTVVPPEPPIRGTFTVYIAKQGDSFELLAYRKYGDCRQFWQIAQLNPAIGVPDRITAGTMVRVPV